MTYLRIMVLGIAALMLTGSAQAHAPHPALTKNVAWLNAVFAADQIDNRLYRGGYLSDEITNPENRDQLYDIDAEVTRARRESPYRCRLRIYFYDGPNNASRFIGLAKITIRVNRRGRLIARYGWLKPPRRPID